MRTLLRLILLGAVMLAVGCGLPDTYYLQPPIAGQPIPVGSSLNQSFGIVGSSRANDVNVTFSGYELYYKCYGTSDPLTPDENYGTSNTYTDLLQNGFHRLCRGPGLGGGLAVDTTPGTGNAPLINIQKIDPANVGSTFTITIKVHDPTPPAFNFATNNTSGSTPTIPVYYFEYFPPSSPTTPTAGWEIRRFLQADPTIGLVCRTFVSNYYYPGGSLATTVENWNATDLDISSAIWSEVIGGGNGGLMYVMLYALSYGTAIDGTFQESSPVWLGYTEIQPYMVL